jgi:hypothetical protein
MGRASRGIGPRLRIVTAQRDAEKQKSARRSSTVIAGEGGCLLEIRASDTSDLERIVGIVQGARHSYRTATDVVFPAPFEGRRLRIRAAARPPRSDSPGEA